MAGGNPSSQGSSNPSALRGPGAGITDTVRPGGKGSSTTSAPAPGMVEQYSQPAQALFAPGMSPGAAGSFAAPTAPPVEAASRPTPQAPSLNAPPVAPPQPPMDGGFVPGMRRHGFRPEMQRPDFASIRDQMMGGFQPQPVYTNAGATTQSVAPGVTTYVPQMLQAQPQPTMGLGAIPPRRFPWGNQ